MRIHFSSLSVKKDENHHFHYPASVFYILFCVFSSVSCCGKNTTIKDGLIEVSTEQQLIDAVINAKPGTIIEVADGDYRFDDAPLHINLKGNADFPIIVRAKHQGKTQFSGEYSMLLKDCSYVTVEGITLKNRALKHALSNVTGTETWIEAMRDELPYHGSLMVLNCDHCRLTRLSIQLEEQKGFTPKMIEDRLPRMHWINLSGGKYNRIDHCRMERKRNSGVYIEIGPLEQHFRIDRNHFAGRSPGNYNGFEIIRCNPGNLNNMYGLIEYNLFENCDGEGEIISVKSSYLRISHNTFRDCKGMLCIRMGSQVTVDYNFFLNPSGKEGVGGVRIHGNDNNILNNYFGDLTGYGLMTFWGDYDKPDFTEQDTDFFRYNLSAEANSYRRTCRARIAFNTWANCSSFLHLGEFRKNELADMNLPPKDWTIMNNIVMCKDTQFVKGKGETGFRWFGNMFWNPEGKCNPGREFRESAVIIVDPQLVKTDDGLWHIIKDSPAVDNMRGWYYPAEIIPDFKVDIDGQPRDLEVKVTEPQEQSEFKFDVGADEFSDAALTNRPLTNKDVGPNVE
ncbi:MAG: polysaccharide lyase 6 family protein [Candidatus Latescibacteria bacterium]|nr:polysaccharide lyase 6 family protein [Candidatus Latescibacterota bacterium]